MPRGYVYGIYVADNQEAFAYRVDADYFGMTERGWISVAPLQLPTVPRMLTPRRVFGFDSAGNRQFAVAASVGALIWTGESSTFAISANDGQLELVTVAGRLSERRVGPS